MNTLFPLMVGGLCLVFGTLALVSRPAALASWLFFSGMFLLAVDCLLDPSLGLATGSGESGNQVRATMLLKSFVAGVWLGFSLVYARGKPTEFLRRWKWILLAAVLIPAALVLGFPDGFQRVAEPGAGLTIRLSPIGKAWVITMLLITLAILINFEKTFRAAVGMTRWRIKYLILGAALIFGVRVYTLSQMLLFSGYRPEFANLTLVALFLGCVLIGVGQVRSSFGEFDIYPSRAVLQGSATVILAGVYFVIVGLLAQWVALLGGIAHFPAQALVLLLGVVGVTVMVLSERFRMTLRRFISRHFSRPEHDFRKVWTEFTRRTSSVLDAATLGKNAGEVIAESFHVLGVTLFRVAPETPGLEWLHSTEKRVMLNGPKIDAGNLAGLANRGHPFVLEAEHGAWAEALRESCPKKFQHGGDRLVVPLVAAEHLVGLMVLADRVNGVPYTHEELDLLKCIGDQLAGALLNCSLTDEVLQAKELEAFQTLSTFFVHDLKNAANGLSLMLQNLPTHFDDPEFRSDTIRGVGRTVERINQLILKLSSLRRELQLTTTPCRLDLLCAEVLDGLDHTMDGKTHLERDLRPVPAQSLDAEAMRSVVTNLVTNAREALNGGGAVKVATRLETKGVTLAVADNGCGMRAEFVKNLLFRPFHSTKTKGLGIGMFQCKKIIAAHGGSISVESQPGKGTCFTILLPLATGPQSNQPNS
jgi:putative PEP-CTERM system histidine kinase